MPTIQHSLSEVIAALSSKISDLESAKQTVQTQIEKGHRVPENTACLQQINESLEAATQGKTRLHDSCCTTQSCNFEYFE